MAPRVNVLSYSRAGVYTSPYPACSNTARIRSVIARSSRISSGSTSRVPLGMRSTMAGFLDQSTGSGVNGHVVDPLDSRSQIPQSLVDPLVAAVDLADVADLGGAVGAQRGDQHGHPGPDIRRLHSLPGQEPRTEDDRAVGITDRDRRAHQLQLVAEEQPVLEHLLVDHDRPL